MPLYWNIPNKDEFNVILREYVMKKIQLGLAIIGLGLASSAVFAAPDGTVTITGKVIQQTCTLAGTSGNYTVSLPTVAASSFTTGALTNGETKYTINLTNCPAGAIGVYYDNTGANVNTSGRLNNTVTGGSNVNVQLLNSAKTAIDLSKDRTGQNLVTATAVANGAVNLDFYARYYATATATTVGDVSTTVGYYVIYP